VLGSLFIAHLVDAVSAALAPMDRADPIAVIGPPRLARALVDRGHKVIFVAAKLKSLRRVEGARLYGAASALPIADGAVAATVTVAADPGDDDWAEALREWCRVVSDGGLLVMVERAARVELSRRALCAGLADVQQREAGRNIVTSGVVVKL
jgi:hypothetical protein